MAIVSNQFQRHRTSSKVPDLSLISKFVLKLLLDWIVFSFIHLQTRFVSEIPKSEMTLSQKREPDEMDVETYEKERRR